MSKKCLTCNNGLPTNTDTKMYCTMCDEVVNEDDGEDCECYENAILFF